tara:strand:- start:98011 stop:99504 length:1494 start_codon:yes stop_codon:yes gene_type:complete
MTQNLTPLVLLAAGSLLSVNLAAQASFSTATLPVGVQPNEVQFGDVDLDGDLDLFVTVDNPINGVSIWANDGLGNFSLLQNVLVANQSRTLVAEDLDGDGDIDLAVGVGTGQVALLRNDSGLFTSAGSVAVGINPRGMTVADFNGDARLDLAVANRDSNSVTVLLNLGGLAFSATTMPAGTEPRAVVGSDLNADGRVDLVVANHDSRDVSVRLNLGAGTFGPETRLSVAPTFRGEWVTTTDIDADGDLDLVVALGETVGVVGVFANSGAGTFGPLQVVPVGGQEPGTVLAMDINGDRVPDLVTANEDSNNVSVLFGTGVGGFVTAGIVPTGSNPNGLAGGDIDGDGDMDFATANRNSNSVTVLRNTTLAAATAPTMTAAGAVAVGQTTPVLLSSPQDAGMFYLSALSRFGGPAIPLGDGRSLPVGPSDVLNFTLGSNPVYQDSFGMLSGSGHAFCQLVLPNTPLLNGFTFYGTFLVFDGGRFRSIGSIADQVIIQVP